MGLPTIFLMFIVLSFPVKQCQCFNPKLLNVSESFFNSANWNIAGATWYGSRMGAGTDGGACSYRDAVRRPPYSSMVSAGGPSIYQNGQGCGVCYQKLEPRGPYDPTDFGAKVWVDNYPMELEDVRCTGNTACSGSPVIVTITDECPGCTNEATHFDLSGTAFGAMAKPGLADQLRNAGVLQVQYRLVECNYQGTKVVIRVDQGSNPFYFAAAILFVDGTGIANVELQQKTGGWTAMRRSSGATFALNIGSGLQAPFSLRLTDRLSRRTITLAQVIPVGWQPGQIYRSSVNFD